MRLLLLEKEMLCTVCYATVLGSKQLEGRFTREEAANRKREISL